MVPLAAISGDGYVHKHSIMNPGRLQRESACGPLLRWFRVAFLLGEPLALPNADDARTRFTGANSASNTGCSNALGATQLEQGSLDRTLPDGNAPVGLLLN